MTNLKIQLSIVTKNKIQIVQKKQKNPYKQIETLCKDKTLIHYDNCASNQYNNIEIT